MTKNPIVWNGKKYWTILADLDGNVFDAYTWKQGEEAGWDLFFEYDTELRWDAQKAVLISIEEKTKDLVFQWSVSSVYPNEPTHLEKSIGDSVLKQIKIKGK